MAARDRSLARAARRWRKPEHEIGDEERCPRDGHHQKVANHHVTQRPGDLSSRILIQAGSRQSGDPAPRRHSKVSEVDALLATCERTGLRWNTRGGRSRAGSAARGSYQSPLTEKLKIWTLSPCVFKHRKRQVELKRHGAEHGEADLQTRTHRNSHVG